MSVVKSKTSTTSKKKKAKTKVFLNKQNPCRERAEKL